MTDSNTPFFDTGFQPTLPSAEPGNLARGDISGASIPTQDGPLKVLVIEDNEVDFMQVSQNLRHGRLRLVLTHATSIGAAIDELKTRSFDVILTDLHLPDGCGLDTVKRLREQCDDAPILVLTGLDDETVEVEILQAGAQDYLPKGAASSEWMRKAIEHAVQRQRSVNEMRRVTDELKESHQLLRHQSELREQDNKKLERLYQTAQEFLAKASHDIRNPLTVIKEHVSIVRDGLAGQINSEQASMLEKAMVRADDVNAKLDDLLDSSKLDSGLLDICRRPCHAGEIIDQVRSALSQRAAMRGILLEIQPAVHTPMAYCDEQKACRVLTGLGINAINACVDSGHVNLWVRHEPKDQELRFGVTDDGVGIMPAHREKLSARFNRPGLTTEPEDKILGLGLSIAARFCRLNLGQLHVESEAGLGSIFWFGVPTIDSNNLFPRWLELQTAPMEFVFLTSFHLSHKCSDAEKRDIELLLTYLTENDEMLIHSSPAQWWLASSSIHSDAQARLNKANSEIKRLTEVRAASPVAHLGIETRAIWDLRMPATELIREYHQIVNPNAVPFA